MQFSSKNREEFYRHQVESSLGMICSHDLNGKLLTVNEAAARALGFSPDELIGTNLHERVPEALRPRFAAYLRRVISSGQANGLLTLLTRDKQEVNWMYRNQIFREPDGSMIVMGHAQDITRRLAMERRLKESEEQFRALFEDAPVAYHEIDCHGVVVRVNRAECELFCLPKNEILGRPVWELFAEESRMISQEQVSRKLRGEPTALRFFRDATSRDGRLLHLDIHDKIIRSSDGTVVGIRSTLLDVTEQYRAEQELRALNAELDRRVNERTSELKASNARMREFVYTVSHDLQEPLRNMKSFASLLEKRYKNQLDEDGVEFLGYISSGAKRMSVLIADLLAYSRVLHDHQSEFQQVALEEAVRVSRENLASLVVESKAIITHDSLPVVDAQANRMVQLFQNLLSNAIKYRSEKAPAIHVSASETGDGWLLSVSDNGVGVAESDRFRIFEVFKRVHDGRTAGSGIGLAICQAIVQQHGGRIWVDGIPGGGSAFRFTIPRSVTRS